MLLAVLLACVSGVPLEMTVTSATDAPEVVREALARRVESAGGDVKSVVVEGTNVRLSARVPEAPEVFRAGLLRQGRLEVREVDDVLAGEVLEAHGRAFPPTLKVQEGPTGKVEVCGDAAALQTVFDGLPIEHRTWGIEPRSPAPCGILMGPPREDVAQVEGAEFLVGKGAVQITLTEASAARFAELTRTNVGWRVAVLVDGEVVAAPKVVEEIAGGKVMLSFSPYEGADALTRARTVAVALGGGALRGPLQEVR